MNERTTIVCLANSRKHNGRCIAGIEIVDRQPEDWVRPVSSRAGAEVSEYERQYEDGSDPRVLDMIAVMTRVRNRPGVGRGPVRTRWRSKTRPTWSGRPMSKLSRITCSKKILPATGRSTSRSTGRNGHRHCGASRCETPRSSPVPGR